MAAAVAMPTAAQVSQAPCIKSAAVDLHDCIDKAQCFCLNEEPGHTFQNLFMGDERLYLQSDSDEQLLIHLNFKECVNLNSISFCAPEDETAPLTVKLFANKLNLGFSDVEDLKADQILDLTPADLVDTSQTNLYTVKFQRVSSLTIFVEENNGEEVTKISGLKIFGTTVQGTNMSEFKKVGC